jgi:hypothetical protein
MRLTPSDPDIETLIGRIKLSEIDLQPDFQRGEVWATPKKQRLIDSVLRDWHIPPIHVVLDMDTQEQSVLDGQQRLVAIRDFANNKFGVDGAIEPFDPDIAALDGLTYDKLPPKWKRQFDQFTIRVFRITDYDPSEPGELFYRLNQPSALTAAEQRNAFFGKVRSDVKKLVTEMQSGGLSPSFWGFSNARMAYDDVIARTCLILDNGTFKKKVSSSDLVDQYRSDKRFSSNTIQEVSQALELLGQARRLMNKGPKLNKATAQSWLIFLSSVIRNISAVPVGHLASFIEEFELTRSEATGGKPSIIRPLHEIREKFGDHSVLSLMRVYEDRSTSRVADTTSVILRDFVLWISFFAYCAAHGYIPNRAENQWPRIAALFNSPCELESERDVEELAVNLVWGDRL